MSFVSESSSDIVEHKNQGVTLDLEGKSVREYLAENGWKEETEILPTKPSKQPEKFLVGYSMTVDGVRVFVPTSHENVKYRIDPESGDKSAPEKMARIKREMGGYFESIHNLLNSNANKKTKTR